MMTALEILKACRAADDDIAELTSRMEQRRSAMTRISAPMDAGAPSTKPAR